MPRHLYLSDQDAQVFKDLLERRTNQLARAHIAIGTLTTIAIALAAILFAVAS